MTILGPVGQVARIARDINESEGFYGGVLGLPHLYTYGALAFFELGLRRMRDVFRLEPVGFPATRKVGADRGAFARRCLCAHSTPAPSLAVLVHDGNRIELHHSEIGHLEQHAYRRPVK